MEKLPSVGQVADLHGLPVNALYQWPHKGTRPPPSASADSSATTPADVRARLEAHAEVTHGVG